MFSHLFSIMKEKAASVGERIRAVSTSSLLVVKKFNNNWFVVGKWRPLSNLGDLYLYGPSFAGSHVIGVILQVEISNRICIR
jgi:hypothetical protein